jgi:hypothetical protein
MLRSWRLEPVSLAAVNLIYPKRKVSPNGSMAHRADLPCTSPVQSASLLQPRGGQDISALPSA